MRINLLEIPDEGLHYVCNNKTGDLNESLADLIGKTPHHAEFMIKPLSEGNYELSGKIKTELPEECSRCGLDFNFAVDVSFRELLIPKAPQPRDAKYMKANHFSDLNNAGPSVVEYNGHHFEMGEYLHEAIGITEPLNPAPAENAKGDCSVCLKPVKGCSFNYEDKGFEEKPESPFSVLKGIKLN